MKPFSTKKGTILVMAGVASVLALLANAILTPIGPIQSALADENADRVALNEQYLAEAQALANEKESLHDEVTSYEEQKDKAVSEDEKEELDAKIKDIMMKVDELDQQIRELEKLNQALYVMEPSLEAKLYSIEKDLIDRYLDNTSKTYVGENPVDFIFADVLTRSIVIYVDPDKAASDGSNVPVETSIDGIPVMIKYSKTEPLSCSPASRTGVCRPIKGGVSTAEVFTQTMNTIGYKAVRNGFTGFVVAGHTAIGPGHGIIQPHNDPNKVVGTVQGFCRSVTTNHCDFAFVKANPGITVMNHIYGSSDFSVYVVTQKTPDSGQALGTYIYQSSAISGLRIGDINGQNPNSKYNIVNINPVGGDSGSPLFLGSGFTANLYGMTFKGAGSYTLYYPQDWIQTTISAVASTS